MHPTIRKILRKRGICAHFYFGFFYFKNSHRPLLASILSLSFTAEKAILSRLSSTQGESSEIDRPSPETVGTISVGNTISSHNDRKSSETLDEPSVVTNQSSVFNDKITDKSPVINDETSVMTDNNSLLNSKASEMIDATLDDSYTREVSRDDNVANVEATISENISAPHSWICRRPMLRLHAADHVGNLLAFQGRWLKGEVSQDIDPCERVIKGRIS